jgi:MscS family membrane protein
MIPVELIRALPDWMQHQYMDQTVWQWGLLIVTVLILLGVILLLHALVERLARRGNRLHKNLLYLLWSIAVIYLILGSRAFLDEQVILSGEVLQDVLFVVKIAILAAVVSLVVRFAGVLTEAILSARHFETRRIDQQLVRLGVRMLTILIASIIVIEGMQQIGFSLATLVAGAGVTGLAIALAAQDTLKNVFGGVLLAMDRPFEVGQRVRMKGYEGFIKEVGLRSTKIRTVKGHEIIIPNDEAARIEVENIGRRPNIRRDMNVTITYDTPPAKIARAVEILREILAVPDTAEDEGAAQPGGESTSHPNEAINQPGFPPRAFFNELNADSLNLLVTYWFHPPDRWKSIEFAHRINMQIMERFNAEGIDFAFPSQTMYLAGDSRRPLHLDQRHFPPGRTNSPTDVSSTGVVTTDSVFQPVEKGASKYASVEEDVLSGEDGGEGEGPSS